MNEQGVQVVSPHMCTACLLNYLALRAQLNCNEALMYTAYLQVFPSAVHAFLWLLSKGAHMHALIPGACDPQLPVVKMHSLCVCGVPFGGKQEIRFLVKLDHSI